MAIKVATIADVLTKLDTANDSHWTADGLPSLETIAGMLGRDVTRKEVTDTAPNFSREALRKADEEDLLGGAPVTRAPTQETAADVVQTEFEMREAALKLVQDAEAKLRQFDADTAGRKLVRDTLQADVDRLRDAMQRKYPPLRPEENAKLHIMAEQRKRLQQGPAKIDITMARRNTRGWRRPNTLIPRTHGAPQAAPGAV